LVSVPEWFPILGCLAVLAVTAQLSPCAHSAAFAA
jgi:hypothetical protein